MRVDVLAGSPVEALGARAATIPTDAPESDGTFEWDSTTIVVVTALAGGMQGVGWSYTTAAAGRLVVDVLADRVIGRPASDIPGCWSAMVGAVRNLGRPGVASTAIAAVDTALWDLKARLLGVPLAVLLGRVRDGVPVYGSGGFTSYGVDRLQAQLGRWVEDGIGMVKMKVGRDPAADAERVRAVRTAIGPDAGLFVDANGAYTRQVALAQSEAFADAGVSWFEEPVSSDDLEGLRLLRDRSPAGMAITAGEYGYDLPYFRRMLAAGAVDALQADATRCAGLTGFLQVGALCQAWLVPLSAHTAPSLHVHACCALPAVAHVEWFHDHVRIEQLLFDGAPAVDADGRIRPSSSRPGLGVELKEDELAPFVVFEHDARRVGRSARG